MAGAIVFPLAMTYGDGTSELGEVPLPSAFCALVLSLVLALPCSAAPPPICAGDCGGDGQVTIDELIAGVDIALGIAPVSGCRAADLSGEGRVGIDELVRAVQAALMACPPTPTRTETVPSTPTPTTSPTSTATAVPSNTPTDTATPLLPTSTPSHTATASPTPTAVPVTHTPVAPTPIPTATPTLQAVPPGNVELTIAPVVPDDPDSPTGFFAVQLGGGNRASAVEGGPLRLLAGLRDADGIAPLSLMDDVVFAVPTAIATYCFRLVAAGSSGYIDCDGGSGVDVVRESNPGATPGDIILFVGGNDSGPGAAVLFIETQEVATLPTGAPTGACATASYAAPLPARYTTGLASELHEGLERRRGVNFACDFSGGGLGAVDDAPIVAGQHWLVVLRHRHIDRGLGPLPPGGERMRYKRRRGAAFDQGRGVGENVVHEGGGAEIEGHRHVRAIWNGLRVASIREQTDVLVVSPDKGCGLRIARLKQPLDHALE